eukprot:Amastigsp_a681781_6.p4 type:complete len:124 gc:universal Amastigsp_a681781_6:1126-755(-)
MPASCGHGQDKARVRRDLAVRNHCGWDDGIVRGVNEQSAHAYGAQSRGARRVAVVLVCGLVAKDSHRDRGVKVDDPARVLDRLPVHRRMQRKHLTVPRRKADKVGGEHTIVEPRHPVLGLPDH